jgi:hypothetical protein
VKIKVNDEPVMHRHAVQSTAARQKWRAVAFSSDKWTSASILTDRSGKTIVISTLGDEQLCN